jgi:hypothetical protein
VETHLLKNIRNIRPREGELPYFTNQFAILIEAADSCTNLTSALNVKETLAQVQTNVLHAL